MFGRILKLASIAVVVGVVAFELASPLWLRWEVGRRAAAIADDAAEEFARTANSNRAEELAARQAARHSLVLVGFQMIPGRRGEVEVRVTRSMESILLDEIGPTKSWYTASATGSSFANRPFRGDQ